MGQSADITAEHAEHGHDHLPNLAHHFDTPPHQFQAEKLGMWLFLATEILFFGGLFCAYAVFRARHPEIFIAGHHHLNPVLGGINTAVLIASSFTMAWAVRAAQLSQKKLLITLLSLTLLGAFGFMGIKFIEYKQKWEHGLMPGPAWNPQENAGEHADAAAEPHAAADQHAVESPGEPQAASPNDTAPVAAAKPAILGIEPSTALAAAAGPAGALAPGEQLTRTAEQHQGDVNVFFGIYFAMTGLHAFHVLAGIVVIGWLILRSINGDFGAEYYAPVDCVGLYWHVVDLIWIFLFPLLYLIH